MFYINLIIALSMTRYENEIENKIENKIEIESNIEIETILATESDIAEIDIASFSEIEDIDLNIATMSIVSENFFGTSGSAAYINKSFINDMGIL